MPRFFNTAGPCRPEIHYTLSATDRLPNIERLIEQESYFVIHAPRQTGKSTAMLTLAQQLLEQGKWVAVTVSAEVGAPFPHDPGQAELAVLESWRRDSGGQPARAHHLHGAVSLVRTLSD